MKISNKKSLLKVIGTSALATCMLATSLFAFIPNSNTSNLTANAQNNETTTESAGLITPHADDPVLFTTESGLEIKYGNATIQPSLESGNLSGFPYFTTNDGSKDYVWVIIGQSSTNPQLYYSILEYQVASWLTDDRPFVKYFLTTTYETTSPAGNKIISDKLFTNSFVYDGIKCSDEIPEGCVLVLANECVGTGIYRNSRDALYYNGSQYNQEYGPKFSDSVIKSTMNTYYTNGSLGLSLIKSAIQNTTIIQHELQYTQLPYDQVSSAWLDASCTAYIFPLGGNIGGNNFIWSHYLTADQIKLSVNQWTRGMPSANCTVGGSNLIHYWNNSYLDNTGTMLDIACNTTSGYRPAFVMSLV